MEYPRDVRTRHLHPLSKLRLRHSQLLHPEQNAAEERGTDFINRLHSLQPTFGSPGGGGRWRWTMERLNPFVRLRLTPHLLKPITQSPSFHQPRHTLQTHSSPPPPTPTGNSFTLYRPSTNSCNINSHHVNTYFLVAATTVFLTFSQVKLLSNISGIGSSSASSKYINPRRGKESSETENFSLYKESI